MPLPDQVSLLCRAIREKGRKEAGEILSRAREQADRILQEASENTQRNLEERISQKRQSAYQQAQHVVSAAELETGQQVMVTRQALLREMFDEAGNRLSVLRDEPEYPNMLRLLAIHAVSSLPEEHCWIQVRKNDQGLFSQDMLMDISKETGQTVELLPEPADINGGCIAFSANKKILVDFSFDVLLKRAEPRLKELMANIQK
ncbi:MAG: V-type ATP synthase subunit E [Thermodesulfobacteriota bacterium]|nr:V-type ATP synthase subunit E [Thermodesulfobacteriota bacterium]